jgi:hypothetical protein
MPMTKNNKTQGWFAPQRNTTLMSAADILLKKNLAPRPEQIQKKKKKMGKKANLSKGMSSLFLVCCV